VQIPLEQNLSCSSYSFSGEKKTCGSLSRDWENQLKDRQDGAGRGKKEKRSLLKRLKINICCYLCPTLSSWVEQTRKEKQAVYSQW
jgi:hypothetical protein